MKTLVVCKHSKESNKSKVCEVIRKKGIQIIYSWKNTLSKKELKNIDLVIAIGGDGTALSASHYIKDEPILIVNSSPKTSVGALATIPIKSLNYKLEQIKSGNYKTENLERIRVEINNNKIEPLALNDIFIANQKAYLISKYKIIYNKKEEIQSSSGLIFSTGTGSTAWFASAGGKPFNPHAKHIKLIVREPYEYKKKLKIKKLIIKEGKEIIIKPLTDSILAIDSIREYKLKSGDEVKIKISNYQLKRII